MIEAFSLPTADVKSQRGRFLVDRQVRLGNDHQHLLLTIPARIFPFPFPGSPSAVKAKQHQVSLLLLLERRLLACPVDDICGLCVVESSCVDEQAAGISQP